MITQTDNLNALRNSAFGKLTRLSFTPLRFWSPTWGQLASSSDGRPKIAGIEPATPTFHVQLPNYRVEASSLIIWAPKRPYLTTPTKLNFPASNPPTKVLLLTIFDRDFWSARQVGVWSLAENIVPEKQRFHWMNMCAMSPCDPSHSLTSVLYNLQHG